MALTREKFTECVRTTGITDSHLNSNYAARIVGGATAAELAKNVPATNLVGSAANADEVYGEIKWAAETNKVTVQTGGIVRLKTTSAFSFVVGMSGQGVQAVGTGNDVGLVENSGTVGDGFGRILGYDSSNTALIVDADA